MGAGSGKKQRLRSAANMSTSMNAAATQNQQRSNYDYLPGEQNFSVHSHEDFAALIPTNAHPNNLVILVGTPGSGKSHWAAAFAAANDYEVVETDAIRKKITGGYHDQSENARVFDEFYEEVRQCLAAGESVVADSTGINAGIRFDLRWAAEDVGEDVGVHVVVFDNQHQTRFRNLRRLGRKYVPRRVRNRMRASLETSKQSLCEYEAKHYRSLFFITETGNSFACGKYWLNPEPPA